MSLYPLPPRVVLRKQTGPSWTAPARALRCCCRAALVAACLLPAAGAAAADREPVSASELVELPLEQLMELRVTSASRFEQKRSEAPANVTVITARDIQVYGWRTLADALATLPGLYINYDRSYHFVGARGFQRAGDYNSRFLVLVDGTRINDSVYDQAAIGSDFLLDLDLVERIEYVPGPGSAVYGSSAFFGVINVITRKAADLRGAELALAGGGEGYRRVRGSYGWQGEDAELLLSATRHRYDGADLYFPEYDTPDQNGGVAEGLDYDRYEQLFGRLRLGDLSLTLAHQDRDKGVPTGSYEQNFNARGSELGDTHSALRLQYRHDWSARTEINAGAFYGQYRYRGDYLYGEPVVVNRDDTTAAWYGLELQAVTTRFARHKLAFGLSLEQQNRRQRNVDLDPYAMYLASDEDGDRYGVYVQDEFRWNQRLLFNLGGRFDNDSSSGNNFSPRAGLIYRLLDDTTIKALYGSAYRAPNAFELYYDYPGEGGQRGNRELDAEEIRTSEIAVEHRLHDGAVLTGSLYYYDIEGLITQTLADDDIRVYQNVNRIDARGLELAYERLWSGGARLRASYALQEARDRIADRRLENSPRHLGKLNLAAPVPYTALTAGFELRGMSAREGKERVEYAGYWLANLTLLWPGLFGHADVSASIYNLFDQHYEDPVSVDLRQGALEQDRRAVVFKLVYGF